MWIVVGHLRAAGITSDQFDLIDVIAIMVGLSLAIAAVARWQLLRSGRRADRALRNSERRLRLLAEASADVIVMADLEMTVLYVSAAVRTVLGWDPESFLGRRLNEFIHPDDVDEARARLASLMADGHLDTYPFRARHHDGGWVWTEATGRVVSDEDGTVTGVFVCARDISQRRRAEAELGAQQQQNQLITATSGDPFVSSDDDGRIVEWNRSAELLFGWRRAEVVGRNSIELLSPPRMRFTHSALRESAIQAQGTVPDQVKQTTMMHRDGRELPVETTVWSVRTEGRIRVNTFMRDARERKEPERTLTNVEVPRRRRSARPSTPDAAPAAPAKAPAKSTELRLAGPDGRAPRILLAEDDAAHREATVEMLTGLGCLAEVAEDGLRVLDLVGRGHFEAVLMDCDLPELDGYLATEEIRRREGNGLRTPIIGLTAAGRTEDRARCLGAGMDDSLVTPFTPEELGAILSHWLLGVPATVPVDLPDTDQVGQRIEDRLHQIRGADPAAAQDLIDRLLTSYLRRVPSYLARLSRAVALADVEALAGEAHSLQGVAANLGVVGVADACADLVEAARGGRLDLAPGLVERVRTAQDRAESALKSMVTS